MARRFASAQPDPDTASAAPGSVQPTPAQPISDKEQSEKPKSNRGRKKNPNSINSQQPWLAAGISRAAWYLNKRVERLLLERITRNSTPIAKPKPEPEPDDDIWG